MIHVSDIKKGVCFSVNDPSDLFPTTIYGLVTMVSPRMGILRVRFLDGVRRGDDIYLLEDSEPILKVMSLVPYKKYDEERLIWRFLMKTEESIKLRISKQTNAVKNATSKMERINAQYELGKTKSHLSQFHMGKKLFGRICARI